MPTIQAYLEDAISDLFGSKIHVVGAGRTDAGVHAINQTAHFTPTRDARNYSLTKAFLSALPSDIVVKKAELAPPTFNAQKSASGKTYLYRIWNQPIPSAIHSKRALYMRVPLDLDILNKEAQDLVGTHDFNCFRTEGSGVGSTIRTITDAKFTKSQDFVEFRISGSGFLRQMVRNIVGTLLQIPLGHRKTGSIAQLIASKDRTQAGPAVPAHGLYMESVHYPEEITQELSLLDNRR